MRRFYDESSALRSQRARAITSPGATAATHRIAVIGTGMMGREHMRVATLLGRARIAGILDPSAASMDLAEAAFRHYSDRPLHRYGSILELCDDPSLDALIISSPNHTHWQVVQAVLGSGKALLVEKPMATTLDDALCMWRALRDAPNILQLGMQYRFKAQYVDIFRSVKKNQDLGRVRTISMCEYRPPFLDKVQQWNKFSVLSGGTLVEKCCHYFDLINQMAEARPLRVYASGGRAVNFLDFEQDGQRSDIDDHAFVTISYDNGIRASFALNMFCQELYEELIIGGERGRAVATERASFKSDGPSRSTLQVEVEGHPHYLEQTVAYPRIVEESGHYGATFFAQEAFMDRLEGRAADGATVTEGLWAMIVATAAQESIRTDSVIEIAALLRRHGASPDELGNLPASR
ncbi:MAG: myo-inositol 2-dehydrogenase/D-chiro-inositol 1-dehydrogenase [Halieaceae bacterium]|jgi:myo-inositol 2-dehydrogenase/D-chiro-inositol 1-dehydrogenase